MPTPRLRPSTLGSEPPTGSVGPEFAYPRVVVDLRTITPVVGGGVETFEPDVVDPVRVPGIRGQLREWWRRLYARQGESADALFAREAGLWGGVGPAGERAGVAPGPKDGPGLRSRVILRLDAAAALPGRRERAGTHPAEPAKPPKAMPRWIGGQEFGYALFPLQRSESERRRAPRGQELPTQSVRRDLAFRLIVTLRRGATNRGPDDPCEPLRQVLATLWAWIHLGGVGARTRRGFGALELRRTALTGFAGEFADLAREWSYLFEATAEEDFGALWKGSQRAARTTNPSWPPMVLAGGDGMGAQDAHRRILGCLQYFRQGAGFARDQGGGHPGRSRWPEANLLRLHRDTTARWEHPVPNEVGSQLDQLGAPRAAFGLPIVMQFKSAGNSVAPGTKPDEAAAGQVLPQGNDRWASPLLLRPVRWGGEYRPLAVVLGDRVPDGVRIHYDKPPRQEVGDVAVPRSAGARGPIHQLLTTERGRAIQAFVSWLIAERGYQRVGAGHAQPGGSRA